MFERSVGAGAGGNQVLSSVKRQAIGHKQTEFSTMKRDRRGGNQGLVMEVGGRFSGGTSPEQTAPTLGVIFFGNVSEVSAPLVNPLRFTEHG